MRCEDCIHEKVCEGYSNCEEVKILRKAYELLAEQYRNNIRNECMGMCNDCTSNEMCGSAENAMKYYIERAIVAIDNGD